MSVEYVRAQRILLVLKVGASAVLLAGLIAWGRPDATTALGNTTIAFRSERDGNWEIYAMDPEGGTQTNLTNDPAFDVAPAWSPDGSQIAFESTRDGDLDVHVMNADGSGPANLTNHPALDVTPDWSPDGSMIAFVSARDGNREIYAMNADGTGQTRLTDHAASEKRPAWSPDGSRIAFETDRDGNWEIYIMNADGSEPTRLTEGPAADVDPAWAPDGSKIAFASERDGNREIYVTNPDGSGQARLTDSSTHDAAPSWSPDGAKIVFTSVRGGNQDIYVMNANGTGQTRLTDSPAGDAAPDWAPVPPLEPEADTDGDTIPDGIDLDDDNDGCSDAAELKLNPIYGGGRDPQYFWDFFDVPTGAFPNLTRDGHVSGLEFFALLSRFGAVGDAGIDPLSDPPAPPAYHTAYDRYPVDGKLSGPPDGAISGLDFFLVLQQFGHSCS